MNDLPLLVLGGVTVGAGVAFGEGAMQFDALVCDAGRRPLHLPGNEQHCTRVASHGGQRSSDCDGGDDFGQEAAFDRAHGETSFGH